MKHISVIIGDFHKKEADIMLAAIRALAPGLGLKIISEVWVPGSLEKPLALKRELQKSDIDGAVVLGIIERGETKHGLVMGQAVTAAIINLQLEFMKPVGMGILGPEILPDQIPQRVKPYAEAAVRAVAKMLA
jgi:6,7-dimethyl-8-ribityllumazine synthase